jgi:hypothetical protein
MRRTVLPSFVLVATLFGSLALVHRTATASQEATPTGAECLTTTIEENKALVSQPYEAMAANDEAALVTLMAQDLEYYTPSKGERTGNPAGFSRVSGQTSRMRLSRSICCWQKGT